MKVQNSKYHKTIIKKYNVGSLAYAEHGGPFTPASTLLKTHVTLLRLFIYIYSLMSAFNCTQIDVIGNYQIIATLLTLPRKH